MQKHIAVMQDIDIYTNLVTYIKMCNYFLEMIYRNRKFNTDSLTLSLVIIFGASVVFNFAGMMTLL